MFMFLRAVLVRVVVKMFFLNFLEKYATVYHSEITVRLSFSATVKTYPAIPKNWLLFLFRLSLINF